MFLWLMLLLSVTLFNLSFFFSDNLGFSIFFSLILLFYIFLKKNRMFIVGFIWGILVFGFNLIWLYDLLLTKSQASLLLSIFLYLFCVFYYSLLTGLFFGVISFFTNLTKNYFIKFVYFFIGLCFYFYFLTQYSFIIFGRGEGYPFINPLIPLVKSSFFYFFIYFFCHFN